MKLTFVSFFTLKWTIAERGSVGVYGRKEVTEVAEY